MNKQMIVLALAAMLVSSGAFAKQYWGAIYIDKTTGIAGGSRNYDTEEGAIEAAITSCQKKNNGKKSKCIVAIQFSDSCGAVAWSDHDKIAGGGWADSSLKEAENKSLRRCESKGGKECKVALSTCTAWEMDEVIWW